MRHWVIGAVYKDHKRNLECTLVAVSPYKAKSGSYLDFKYIDGTYKRQPASKALSRFEKMGGTIQYDASQIETAASNNRASRTGTGPAYSPAKNITPQIEAFIEATIKPSKRVSKSNVLIRYANVIYVDFIKKCRILV